MSGIVAIGTPFKNNSLALAVKTCASIWRDEMFVIALPDALIVETAGYVDHCAKHIEVPARAK
jgi:hypothetical protein